MLGALHACWKNVKVHNHRILILGDWKTVSVEGIPTDVNDVRLNALSTLQQHEKVRGRQTLIARYVGTYIYLCLEITTYRFAQRAENSEPAKSDKYIVYLARQWEVVFKCHSHSQGLSQVGLCWSSQRRLQENHQPVTRTKKEKVAHALTKTLEQLPP